MYVLHVLPAFYRPKANLFCSKWRNLRVWRHFRVILFNQTELNMAGKTRKHRFSTLVAALFRNKLHVFVACFIVALDPVSLSRKHFHLWKGSCHFHSLYAGVSNWPNNLVLISKEPYNTYNLVKFICLLIKSVIIIYILHFWLQLYRCQKWHLQPSDQETEDTF